MGERFQPFEIRRPDIGREARLAFLALSAILLRLKNQPRHLTNLERQEKLGYKSGVGDLLLPPGAQIGRATLTLINNEQMIKVHPLVKTQPDRVSTVIVSALEDAYSEIGVEFEYFSPDYFAAQTVGMKVAEDGAITAQRAEKVTLRDGSELPLGTTTRTATPIELRAFTHCVRDITVPLLRRQ